MRASALCLGILVVATASGCWRPYYGYNYAQPAYSQPSAYAQPAPIVSQPAPVYTQPAPVYTQPAQVYAQPQVMQQPCICPPNPCCTPY